MATKDTNYLVAVHKGLDESLEKQVAALPEKFNKQRFLQNCMTVLQDGQADFSKCEAPTVVRTLLKGAFLGLDFFNGECYAIPYGNQCQFQTDYKGEIKLCKRYSSNPIQDIYAKVVREGDEFEEVIENGKQYVNFRPKTFSNGEIIGAFAVVLYKDGSMMYDTMSKEDIEHTRQTFSKAANSKQNTPLYKRVPTLNLVDYSDIKVPLVVIYDSPKDFPGKVVARVWDGEKNRPTNVYCEYENLKRCEDDVMSAGFIFKFPRTPEDDACIVTTYMR